MGPAGGPLWLRIWPMRTTCASVRATTNRQRSQRPRQRLQRRARRVVLRCLWTRWRGWRTQRAALRSGGGGAAKPDFEAAVGEVASGRACGAAALGDPSVALARVELEVGVRAGGEQPAGGDEAATRGEIVAAIVPEVDYDDPWLPVVGYSRLVAFASQLLRVMDVASRCDVVIDNDAVRLCESAT